MKSSPFTPIRLLHLAVAGTIAACAGGCREEQEQSPRRAFELDLRDRGVVLQRITYGLPEESTARVIRFDRRGLLRCALYLRDSSDENSFIYVDHVGVVTRNGRIATTLKEYGELLVTGDQQALYIDGTPLPVNTKGWDTFWVSADEAEPDVTQRTYAPVDLFDSFMRTELTNGFCRVTDGSWELKQRGGGMPTEEEDYHNASFQRAVNPFSIRGEEQGRLTYGDDDWMNYHAEASFYFGIPRTISWSDAENLPVETDMLIAQGTTNGNQVAFGWSGRHRGFVLMSRSGSSLWKVLERWGGKRPPLTNWCRIGLRIHAGYIAEGMLDRKAVLRTNLATCIVGPFHVIAGEAPIEADTIRAYSLPPKPNLGDTAHVKSRFFSAKKELGKSRDPTQFGEWSKSTSVFVESRETDTNGNHKAVITMRVPLMGDFTVDSVPFDDEAGAIPPGPYEFAFRIADTNEFEAIMEHPPVLSLKARLSGTGWALEDLPEDVWPAGHREFALRFARRRAEDNRIVVLCGGSATPLSPPLTEPLLVSVARVEKGGKPDYPFPQHHLIRCANLANELFEEAPADWSWIEGAFRMDCRWACMNQWNFMACGSPGIPYMTSKRTFTGDQVHECFMSLRPAQPCDAYDKDFFYDRKKDGGLRLFRANGGWYNRRDLNVCFCTNGRDPLSGYSIVFAGRDNKETFLLRKGRVVAASQNKKFLFHGTSHSSVHWKWWKFTVDKRGGRIRCSLNDTVMFDYHDPEPIPGGHLGFWSVRNGFTLARVISVAESVGLEPHALFVGDDEDSPWVPLKRDSVVVTRSSGAGLTRATATVGGGFFAMRYTLPVPVDLNKTPVMKLPLDIGYEAAVNLHADIGGTAYVIPLTAPISEMKALLAPEFEKGECFKIPTIDEAVILQTRYLRNARLTHNLLTVDFAAALEETGEKPETLELRSITIGNSSNQGYLLAGANGRNAAGAWYEVGVPTFRTRQ